MVRGIEHMDCLGFRHMLGKKGGVTLSRLHGLAVGGETVPHRKTRIQPQKKKWILDFQKHPTTILFADTACGACAGLCPHFVAWQK